MNTTTKAQRINKRQDEIWDKAKRAQAETAAEQSEAPLGRCPKCNKPLRYYNGCLGYEAARCDECNFERDLNAEANGNPPEGEFAPAPAKPAHTPEPWKVKQHEK